MEDQAATLREMARQRFTSVGAESAATAAAEASALEGLSVPRVFTITSGKGGVGKTLVCANLALCLASAGKRVLILDADLGLANIDVVFGLDSEFDLSHVIKGEKSLCDVIVPAPGGVRIIPAASGDEELANLDDNGRLNLFAQFEALEAEIDYLLIDSAAGISKNVIFFNLAAQAPIIVATPEPTSITDAYAVIKVLSQDHGARHFYLIVNRARNEKEGREVYETLLRVSDRFLKSVMIECLGVLPEDTRVNRSIRSRKPIVMLEPAAPVSRAFQELSQRIGGLPARDTNEGYPGFLRGRSLLQTR